MTVTESLGLLGSWEIQLREETPDHLTEQLGFFGHVAIADGPVDVAAVGDGLLAGARYVGVLRAKDKDTGRTLSGSGMVFWLGDEDGKGDILETEVSLTSATLAQAVTAIVGPSTAVTVGTVHAKAGTYTGKHQFQTRREALSIICDAFGVEFRVNGNGTVDVGTAAQLYNTAAPDTIIVRKGAGTDMDLVALGGDYEVGENAYDYSSRVVLLGQTIGTGDTPDTVFATGAADAPSVPYLNLRGNPVKMVRTISESGQTTGSVAARAQLQLNRFNRVARSLNVDADEFETEGNFVVGDNVYVYDPDTGIVNPAIEVTFRGEVLHPDVVRASGITWPVVEGMTVAFRTQAGVWLDLTPFVTWETGGNELTVGDLPKTLTRSGDNAVQARLDAARGNSASDSSIPAAPANLVLTTASGLNGTGQTVSMIRADWDPVTLNTDGSVITDLDHYIVQYHWTGRGPVWQSTVTADTDVDVQVTPSLPYEARVAAVDIAGHQSAWSATVGITSAKDAVAPPAPADPIVTTYLGQMRIEYPGTAASGQPMPSDTKQINVHVGDTDTFTATAATRVDSITPFAKGVSYATGPKSLTNNRWVRLIAEDHDGNLSPSSAVVGGKAGWIIGNNDIALASISDALISTLQAGKITAGTISADITVSGRFATALTGARREMNAVGFQAYDASENLTINLDGVNNLLTGRYRTAISGRRLEMGAAGNTSRIQFYAPDGTTTEIGGFTATIGAVGTECIRLGAVLPGMGFWNKHQIQNDGSTWSWSGYHKITVGGDGPETSKAFVVAYASSRGTDTVPPTTTNRISVTATHTILNSSSGGQRVIVDGEDFYVRANDGNVLYWIDTSLQRHAFVTRPGGGFIDFRPHGTVAYNAYRSAHLRLVTGAHANGTSYGGVFTYAIDDPVSNQRIEVTDVSGQFMPLWAGSFVVSSDEAGKRDIRDMAAGSLSKIRALKPRRYAVAAARGQDKDSDEFSAAAKFTDERIGLVAQEVPADLVRESPDSGQAIDMYALLTTTIAAVQELAAEVDSLQPKGIKK